MIFVYNINEDGTIKNPLVKRFDDLLSFVKIKPEDPDHSDFMNFYLLTDRHIQNNTLIWEKQRILFPYISTIGIDFHIGYMLGLILEERDVNTGEYQFTKVYEKDWPKGFEDIRLDWKDIEKFK